MRTMDSNLMLIILMILALVAVAVLLQARKDASHALGNRTGPGYSQLIAEFSSRAKAQAGVRATGQGQGHVQQLRIAPLSRSDAARFGAAWKSLQARFVDQPQGSLVEADTLVRELMQKRGYPMGDFERRAAEISVDHPGVVERYQEAHEIALLDRHGDVDAEDMRQAVIRYRALFCEMLEVQPPDVKY
jgi:hypothetical protein